MLSIKVKTVLPKIFFLNLDRTVITFLVVANNLAVASDALIGGYFPRASRVSRTN